MTADTGLTERERHAWQGFLRMQSEVLARLARRLHQESGLSGSDYEVLLNLSEAPEGRLRAFEIGAATQWEKSRLSHHLTRMAQRGLIERQPCADDSRYANVVLTDAGRAAIVEAAPLHAAHVRALFLDGLTPDQLDALAEIAGATLDHLDKQG